MEDAGITCPNCGYRLATLQVAVQQRASAVGPPDHPLLLRVPEAARRLDISRSTLYALIARADIGVVRIGRSIRIPWHELERISMGDAP